MIHKDPLGLPDDSTPSEAPPSYETIAGPSSSPRDLKDGSSPSSPSASGFGGQRRFSSSTGVAVSSFSAWGWWNKGPSREVKATVTNLVRDLVKPAATASPAAVLDSCADACRHHSVSLSSLLQERSIEGHTPLYWAIVNRPPAQFRSDDPLITTLFHYSRPLSSSTISEVRSACLASSNQALFRRIQPYLHPPSGADAMILPEGKLDQVTLTASPGEAAFALDLEIPLFQKRMHMGSTIPLEFIARGRLWALEFGIAKHDSLEIRRGQWAVKLKILENSAPTYVDSHLVVQGNGAPKPTSMRLKSTMELMSYQSISAPIDEALQDEGSSYIQADGSLKARFEAQLAKPADGECIIC